MKKMFITERSIEEYRKILIKEEKGRLTVEKYVRDMKKFYEYAKGKCISKQLVIDYKYYIESTGDYKISSINSFLASVNHYLEVMNCADMKVKMIKVQKNMFVPEKRELTKGEYECLIDTAASIGNEQLALIIQTLGSTGIRISELKLVMDVGNNEFWASKAYELSGVKARTYYSKSFGALGCSLAKSIGVFYKNKKHIVCVTGDQGFQLNMQELQFISREKIPVLMLIINNRISGMIKDREKREGYAVHTTYDSGYSSPDFKLIAAAYDIGYVKADSFNNLKDIPDNNPFIIDFCADSQLTLEPSLPRGRKMYDMVPELDKYILDDIRH